MSTAVMQPIFWTAGGYSPTILHAKKGWPILRSVTVYANRVTLSDGRNVLSTTVTSVPYVSRTKSFPT